MLRLLGGLRAEEPSVAVRVGENVSLRCPLLDTTRGTLSWYRQLPGQSPELVLSTRSSSGVKFGSSFGPGRVSTAADGSLQLSAAQPSDSGLYFCSTSRGPEREGGDEAAREQP
ncbi:unnamed protein product [Tetraodon nigroviridis]|nr:unnamed protein product [Tetraodon nigroviridis]